MNAATPRTLTLGCNNPLNAREILFGDLTLWWPDIGPDENYEYTLDVSQVMCQNGDTLTYVTVETAPSGIGEITASNLYVDPVCNLISVWLSGGVPGRKYTIRILAVGESGNSYEWPIGLQVDQYLPKTILPPPSWGFGGIITWPFQPPFTLLGPDGSSLSGFDNSRLEYAHSPVPWGLIGVNGVELLGGDCSPLQFVHSSVPRGLIGQDGDQLLGSDFIPLQFYSS